MYLPLLEEKKKSKDWKWNYIIAETEFTQTVYGANDNPYLCTCVYKHIYLHMYSDWVITSKDALYVEAFVELQEVSSMIY